MVKNFEEYINEDYFSKLASRKDNSNDRKENILTEDIVRSYFDEKAAKNDFHNRENLNKIVIKKENGKYVVDIEGCFYMITDIEEIPFQFGKVTGNFSCTNCKKLKSLKGCPREVGGNFYCTRCESITSFEGCPYYVGGGFYYALCSNLVSLQGSPEKVDGELYGIECKKLTSLEGCPKEVGSTFNCEDCGKKFTKDEVKSLCNVKGRIYV